MALTLTEAALFTTNMVKKGVLQTIIKDSAVLQRLPFIDVVGNAYQYLQENTLGTANFYDPGELWVESTPTFTQKTAGIKIMGGDADIDEFLKATRSDKTDLEAETIAAKAKGIRHSFLNSFWYGDSSVNSKEFDGVHKLMPAGQTIHMGSGSTGAAISMATIDQALDTVRDGAPDIIVMTREVRRRIKQYIRANGGLYQAEFSEYGQQLKGYSDVPIYIDDFLTQTETIASAAYTAKTGGATSSMFFLRFGTTDLCGLQNGGLQTKKLGQLESKDAERWRIKWYPGLALFRDISVAMVDGITNAAAGA